MLTRLCRVIEQSLRWILPAFSFDQRTHSKPSTATSSQRTEALLALLRQTLTEGHTRLSLPAFYERVERTPELRGITSTALLDALRALQQQRRILLTETFLALTDCIAAEQQITVGLARLGSRLRRLKEHQLSLWSEASDAQLSAEQQTAVHQLAQARLAVLTGAPGTGKTATIKTLVNLLECAGYRIELTAPTGRAAVRLQEATGKPARTLHRFLRAHRARRSSVWNWLFPAEQETIIVDEASMLDTFLMARLVAVCTPHTKLILVGDVEQLPSVGPGQVLRDLIESDCVPVVELQTNFRQREGSNITAAAEAIKAGIIPALPAPGEAQSDCYFIEANTAGEAAQLIVKAVTRSLPARCGADPYQSIQVLTPKHRGTLGTAMLNALIQDALNDQSLSAVPVTHNQSVFALGDRVLHTKNNYQLGVFNGECGSVHTINGDAVAVQYGERLVNYPRWALPQLTHGFAITIHRAQGSEYPFVIIPIHATQQPMLNRALLYTALTRARKMAIFIGSRDAFAQAIANDESTSRQTGLAECLRGSLPPIPR